MILRSAILNGCQDLIENIKDLVIWARVIVNGGFTFKTLPSPAYLVVPKITPRSSARRYASSVSAVALFGFLVTYEFDADEQARPADVADEPVPRLHLVQRAGRVLAHVGACLEQAVSPEDFQGR